MWRAIGRDTLPRNGSRFWKFLVWGGTATSLKEVPSSVLSVPFVCNILPAAWLCGAEVVVDELDADFMEHADEICDGYREMYPMLDFGGKLTAKPVRNAPVRTGDAKAAAFFSGGVDAWTTLFRHLDERPALMTLWGADVTLDDTDGWEKVWSHTRETALAYDLDAVGVRTDFRSVLKEGNLNRLVIQSKDSWWHGFQHGIAVIAHAAPLAYLNGFQHVYIASSFPASMKGQYTCASDPMMDNHVHFCGCGTVHDGYELDRQQKVAYILRRQAEVGKPVNLRVCWESRGGGNCCRCEKCYRTILELVSEGANPNQYGFRWNRDDIRRCRRDMLGRCTLLQCLVNEYYPPVQERMRENRERIANYDDYNWLLRFDFARFNDTLPKRIRALPPVRLSGKVIRKVKHVALREKHS